MKKWKFSLILIAVVLTLSLLLFVVPFENIFKNIPLIKGFYQNTTLEITTPNGKSLVEIGNKEYGETPVNIQNLTSGEYDVILTRTSNQENYYLPQQFKVILTKNTTSRINMEIGPGSNLHGVILYYTEDSGSQSSKGKITITSNTQNSRIYINEEYLNEAPATNIELVSKEYRILLKADGYEDLEFPIVVRNGYILNIKGYQFPTPITFEENQTDE